MQELTMNDAGRWRVTTSSGSVHVLEVAEKSWVTRMARMEAPTEDVPSVDLRRDDERVALLAIGRLRVGEDGLLILDVRRDGIHKTIRTTTTLTTIEPMEVS